MIGQFINSLLLHGFIGRAVLASVLIGLMAGMVGTFVILRGISLMGDAISHAVIPGVAISHVLGISYLFGASVFGILTAVLIGFISEKSTLKKDSIIGIVFSSFFALGLVMISQIRTSSDLMDILFGNVLTVSLSDIRNIVIVLVVTLVFLLTQYKKLMITSFDETIAKIYGMKTSVIHYAFMMMFTVVIVVSLEIVGAVLIVSMIIAPAAIAYLLTNRLHLMMIISSIVGAVGSVIGIFFSFTLNWPSGASIVLTLGSLFVITFLFAPKKGMITQHYLLKRRA